MNKRLPSPLRAERVRLWRFRSSLRVAQEKFDAQAHACLGKATGQQLPCPQEFLAAIKAAQRELNHG